MSRKQSHRVSKSSPQSRSESPNPLIEPLPSELEADIARVINENLKNVHNTPNKKCQVLGSSIPRQSSNRIVTLIPNFHGIVGPCQTPCPPPPPNSGGNHCQVTNLRSSEIHPTSPGWFGPLRYREQIPQGDGRVPPPFWGPPSPPHGLPYPTPFQHHGPILPMPPVHLNGVSNETQRLPQESPDGDVRPHSISYHRTPGPLQPPFNQVPIPLASDSGTYYLTPPPEPFLECAFSFESGLRTNQGPMHYPMLAPPGQQVGHDSNYHLHHFLPYPAPLHFNGIPLADQRMGQPEIQVQMPRTPPEYCHHLAVQVASPPMPQRQVVLFPEPLNSGVSYNVQDNMMLPSDQYQNIPRSLMRNNVSPPRPAKVKRRGQSFANPVHGHSAINNQRPRRTSLPVVRSPLLEQFRSDRDKSSKTWTINDILGHIVEFSTDQHGSRFIQSNLGAISEFEKQKIFEEIFPDSTDKLIRDVFGNYVIQRFFDLGTTAQKDAFTEVLKKHVIAFSLDIYGCRVVQKAIDSISEEQQGAIIQGLEQDILTCIKDPNANHVIQKLVQTVAPHRLTFLPILCDNILTLGTHSYGCRVLQRCLEHIPTDYQQNILNAIHRHTLDLIHDQYGNYVIQFIIEHGKESDRNITISNIVGKLVQLSRHKYASNVCEKVLIFSDPATRHGLIEEIMTGPSDEGAEEHIVSMIQDQYANYVLQRVLVVAEGTQKEVLYGRVMPAMAILRTGVMLSHPSRPLLSIERLVRIYFANPTQMRSECPEFDNNPNLDEGSLVPPF